MEKGVKYIVPLICQGGPGSATEQIIEVSEKQVADLWRALIPVGEPR